MLGVIRIIIEIINQPVKGDLPYRLIKNNNVDTFVLLKKIYLEVKRVKSILDPVGWRCGIEGNFFGDISRLVK